MNTLVLVATTLLLLFPSNAVATTTLSAESLSFVTYTLSESSTVANTIETLTDAVAQVTSTPSACIVVNAIFSTLLIGVSDCPNGTATVEKLVSLGNETFATTVPGITVIGVRRGVQLAAVPDDIVARSPLIPTEVLLIVCGTIATCLTAVQLVYFVRFRRSEKYRLLVTHKRPLVASL